MLKILGLLRLPPRGSLGSGKRGTVPKIRRAVPIFLACVNGVLVTVFTLSILETGHPKTKWPIFLNWMRNTFIFTWRTVQLIFWYVCQPKCEELSKNPNMCNPITVVTIENAAHYSQSSHENAIPSSSTSPLFSYKEVPPPPQELWMPADVYKFIWAT